MPDRPDEFTNEFREEVIKKLREALADLAQLERCEEPLREFILQCFHKGIHLPDEPMVFDPLSTPSSFPFMIPRPKRPASTMEVIEYFAAIRETMALGDKEKLQRVSFYQDTIDAVQNARKERSVRVDRLLRRLRERIVPLWEQRRQDAIAARDFSSITKILGQYADMRMTLFYTSVSGFAFRAGFDRLAERSSKAAAHRLMRFSGL